MDPFINLHKDVHELVLQHFTVDEILDSTLVSTNWNKLIGNSSTCMSKIWLNVGDRFAEPSREEIKIFRNSERIYENFKISELENGLQILLFPKRKWKRAQIDIQSFINFREYINLLFIVNDSIMELDVFDMDIEATDVNYDSLSFPRLKRLRLSDISSLALKPFVMSCCELRKLVVGDILDHEMANEGVRNILASNDNLNALSLSSTIFNDIFRSELLCKFQLQNLFIDFSIESSTEIYTNFEKFLNTQKLSWIVLADLSDHVTFSKIFNDLISIKRLSVEYFDADSIKFDATELLLRPNYNITQMDFECENLTFEWIRPILNKLNAIEIIYFFHLSREVLEFIVHNLKTVRAIEYCSLCKSINKHDCKSVKLIEKKFFNFRDAF
jgi:hypothetical protein